MGSDAGSIFEVGTTHKNKRAMRLNSILWFGILAVVLLQGILIYSHSTSEFALEGFASSGTGRGETPSLLKADFKAQLIGAQPSSWMNATDLRLKLEFQWDKLLVNGMSQDIFVLPRRKTIARNGVTVASHGGADRFNRLRFMILRWNGPVSLAVYLSTRDQIQFFLEFYDRHWDDYAFTDVHLVLEKVNPESKFEYPHNILREIALDNVQTDYFLTLDADFVTQANASRAISEIIRTDTDLKNALHHKTLMVLPAFNRNLKLNDLVNETNVFEIGSKRLPTTRDRVKRGCQLGAMEPFHVFKFWEGHGPVNYAHWLGVDNATNFTDQDSSFYKIQYETGFEPYVLGYRRSIEIPHYWKGFRGFGFNKYSWFVEANLKGFRFGVLKGLFVTHLDHDYGPSGHKRIEDRMIDELHTFIKYLQENYDDVSLFLHYLHGKHPSFFDDKYGDLDATNRIPYLEYAVQSGFPDQLRCAERAYYIARATHRKMILAPILPIRKEDGGITSGTIFSRKEGVFRTEFDLRSAYLQNVPEDHYVRLGSVIDTAFTFPDVELVDYRDFYADSYSANMSYWVVETKYNHFNTYWMRNRPDLEDAYEEYEKIEYGVPRSISATFRDVNKIASEHEEDIWRFLDSFKMTKHFSLRPRKAFQIRFSHPIRQMARQIQDEIWESIPYATAYLDEDYIDATQQDGAQSVVNRTMAKVLSQIVTWIESNQEASQLQSVGLFLPNSHMQEMEDSSVVKAGIRQMENALSSTYGMKLKVLRSSSFFQLKAGDHWLRLDDQTKQLDMFVDQQLTACSVIGTESAAASTTAGLLNEIRASFHEACDN